MHRRKPKPLVAVVEAVGDVYYWLRCHLWTRYHVVSAREPGYAYGWKDVDLRMLNACFNLLQDFVEGEKPFDRCDYESSPERLVVKSEIEDLYNWWLEERPARSGTDLAAGYDDDQRHLERLIAIRQHLWT